MAALVVATQPFSVVLDDKTNVIVHDGDVYPANDPVVKGREHLFEPAPDRPSVAKRRAARQTK